MRDNRLAATIGARIGASLNPQTLIQTSLKKGNP